MSAGHVIRGEAVADAAAAVVSKAAAAEPVMIVLFGGTGDLAARKLLPGLFALWQQGYLSVEFAILGVAIEAYTDDQFRNLARKAITEHGRIKPADDAAWSRFAERLSYQSVDFGSQESFRKLAARVPQVENHHGVAGDRLFYLAIAPSFFARVTEQLAAVGLVQPPVDGQPWSRVVIEKPFGRDLATARALDADIHRCLREEQIFRIDHYLGKETVQNIVMFRFANGLLEPMLSRESVDQVQITVAETVGMEGKRGAYYDTAGAMRDVGQNHLLQLLAVMAMDAPGGMKAANFRGERLRVLRNLMPITGDDVTRRVVRGQYGAGVVEGEKVNAFRDEFGIAKNSSTESYVAIRAQIDTWRWAGVPFLLRTGKRLPRRATEIAVQFKLPPLRLMECVADEHDGDLSTTRPNTLVFRIQPDEGISMSFMTRRPGFGIALQPVRMDFDYQQAFHLELPEAYEHLLLDAIKGYPMQFMSSDEVDAQWSFVSPILDAWQAGAPPAFPNYEAGSWGPAEADKLTGSKEDGWRHP